jgi:uncharacterized protein (TIGR03382 family)
MKRNVVLVVATILGTSTAYAEHGGIAKYKFSDPRGPGAEYIAPAPAAVSHIIFLNRCTGGCTLHPGNNNSTTDTSSIPSSTANITEYSGTDAQWTQIVSCVRAAYSPFNVTITDQRPASGDYHMAIVAGTASQVGEDANVLGVSPFSCGYIPNSISFSFANAEPTNINDICWTVSQETAHSWGLDHKFDNRDPMTYLDTGPAMKTFQNQAGSCGEYSARACNCTYNNSTAAMNSYAQILATFGSGVPDTTPPTVSITSPSSNGSVMPGFAITANAGDDVGITKVDFTLDGTLIGTATTSPFKATGPATLSQGSHHLEATAYDFSNNTAVAAIDVMYGESCTSSGCTDSTQVCVDGHCVAGPDQTGGLGSPCTDNTSCASGSCGDDGAGNKYCVEPCDPTATSSCPGGFGCLVTTPGSGVCWPGADNGGGGGGCNTGGDSGVILAGLGFAVALVTGRRRRKALVS